MIATTLLMHAPLPWSAHLKAKVQPTREKSWNTIFFTTFLDMGAERAGAHERHKVRKEGFQSLAGARSEVVFVERRAQGTTVGKGNIATHFT